MIAPDKETKLLKKSRLMEVTEFNSMVNAMERFKHGHAVRAITGKKNIRGQKSQDQIFYSVLGKMLLEVAKSSDDRSDSTTEQQLLALKKVYLWYQSNKHVLVKSDGYFMSAQKITQEIQEKKNRPFSIQRRKNYKRRIISLPKTPLKTIESHLNDFHKSKENNKYKDEAPSDALSMFAPSATQDLTTIDTLDTGSIAGDREFFNDLDFARECYNDDDEPYFGLNRSSQLNRPMTAPHKIKPLVKNTEDEHGNIQISISSKYKQPRAQSAIERVHHELSWAKTSPTPLSKLIHKHETKQESVSSKKEIIVNIPTEQVTPTARTEKENKITDPNRIANLVMFKQFCYQHATQQEGFMQQYVHHKHGTRQHYLEFPEKKTEAVVKETALGLESDGILENKNCEMRAYRSMSLKEFLDQDTNSIKTNSSSVDKKYDVNTNRSVSAPAGVKHRSFLSPNKTPHPPTHSKLMKIVQPSNNKVTVSSVYGLVDDTGKLMHTVNQQALPAPTHGWRYPMVPLAADSQNIRREASGMVLALQEGDVVQQKVIVPYTKSPKNTPDLIAEELTEEMINRTLTPRLRGNRPLSAYSVMSNPVVAPPSQCSPRPSPRHITDVHTVYREFKTPNEMTPHSLRSAGAARGPSRPLTAASWGSYPAYSEVSPSLGAASHHTSGTLMHRSVAETMRVRSVIRNRSESGRSSASSYVAQLRAKKRTGGNLPSQTKPVLKKKVEFDLQANASEEVRPPPQLSFLNIVAPMQVDPDNKTSTYIPPGGVYCGTTAAVSIAVDKFEGQFVDDALSDTPLSYEDLESVENKSNQEDSNKGEQNWLKDWLSGGALDGLGMDSTREGGTTYADLISRAAILDSSGDRSYSDEAPSSNGAVGLGGRSPNDPNDLSLSPRSDPLLSHRTNETTNFSDQPNLNTNSKHIEVIYSQSTNSSRSVSTDEDTAMKVSSAEETENGRINETITENGRINETVMENGRTDITENESVKGSEKDVNEEEENVTENGGTSENGSENDSLLESEYGGSSDEDTDFVDYTDDGETNSEFDDDDKFVRQSLIDEDKTELNEIQQSNDTQNNGDVENEICTENGVTSEPITENENIGSEKSPEEHIIENNQEAGDIQVDVDISKHEDNWNNEKDSQLCNVETQNEVQTTDVVISHFKQEDDSKIDSQVERKEKEIISPLKETTPDGKNTEVNKGPENLNKSKKGILKNKKAKVIEYSPPQQEPIIIGEDLPSMVDPQTGSILILEEKKVIEIKETVLSSDGDSFLSQIGDSKSITFNKTDKAMTDTYCKSVMETIEESDGLVDKSAVESDENEVDSLKGTCDFADQNNSEDSTSALSENEFSPSDFDSFSSDSEREYFMKKCDIKIVVTSATKVEKELKQDISPEESKKSLSQAAVNTQSISENDCTNFEEEREEKLLEEQQENNEGLEDANSVVDSQIVDSSIIADNEDKECNGNKKTSAGGDAYSSVNILKKHKKSNSTSKSNLVSYENTETVTSVHKSGNAQSDNSDPAMITFEEVSVVTALSRPVSGRPIPSEIEVRDPFVDMVASTRQKQVEKSIDVHTIFAESTEEYPNTLESRINTEEEKKAIVKMQRAYRCHLARTRAARKFTGIKKETLEWAKAYKDKLKERGEMRKRRAQETRSSARINQQREKNRMKKIGPHTVVYENFHPEPVFPDRGLVNDSAVNIQKCVRGWLIRQQFRKIRAKCESLGDDLVTSVMTYRGLLRRSQHRHGKLKPTLTFTYHEFFHYLSQLYKFKALFKKREFWEEVEESELLAYFNDCNLFPTQDDIDEVVEAVKKSMDRPKRKKKKHSETGMSLDDVLEVAFHIYPPMGAHL